MLRFFRAGPWVAGYPPPFSYSTAAAPTSSTVDCGEVGSRVEDIVHYDCPGRSAFDCFYEVAASASFIIDGGFTKVALQMPLV